MALVHDLITASRLETIAGRAGAAIQRVASPAELPAASELDLLLVDWGEREPDWGDALIVWRDAAGPDRRPMVALFGPHTDLSAHAAAREAGLGPMKARSALFAALPELLAVSLRD